MEEKNAVEYERLYKRTNGGAVQVWWQERVASRYRTHSGQLNGAIVTSGWSQAEAKNVGRANATTEVEQAHLEVQSNYRDKRKRGYVDSLDDVDKERDFFEPMLAQSFKDKFKYVGGRVYYSQPKLDGFRCLGLPGYLQSRSSKISYNASCPHILEALELIHEKYPTLVLDGELYNHELRADFNEISSIVRKENPTEAQLELSRQLIQYHVYDCFIVDDPDTKFGDRVVYLQDIFDALVPDDSPLRLVKTPAHLTVADINESYSEYLLDGYEGQIIRLDDKYEHKRSKFLLKRKEFIDEEYEVLSIEEGDGNRAGMAGFVVLTKLDGKRFKAGINGSHDYARQLLIDRQKYVGGDCTVRYQELTPDGVPRFPVAVALYAGRREV